LPSPGDGSAWVSEPERSLTLCVSDVDDAGVPRSFLLLMALVAAACSPIASKGTIPPPGPDGQIDPGRAPDFIGVAGRDDRIAGWVPKRFLLEPQTGSAAEEMPVYADDLTTLVGHMVPGKGFVPLGVDPATIPDFPVQAGPSVGAPRAPGVARVVYARNGTTSITWVAVRTAEGLSEGIGFVGGAGVACPEVPPDATLVVLDRSPTEPGAQIIRELRAQASNVGWIDVAADGTLTEGEGVPSWWSGEPHSC
jgi:hypothetical protein